MKKLSLLLLVLVLGLSACQTEETIDAEATAEVEEAAAISAHDTYGDALTTEGAVSATTVLADREQYVGKTVKVEGTISEVCQMMGCWLTIQAGDGNNIRVAVPRDDEGKYVYTVPKDISGRHAIVEGTLTEEILTVETQRHLAEEKGEEAPEDLEPISELQMTADGVLIEKAAS
ncbi:MAG TPA: DUF4920 domain-containing protein [Rhodothermales bacterium]|nr:DUF4920 domain-containing protein [Rhodothermales bacterium]